MRLLLIALVLAPGIARASDDRMLLAIGGGVDLGGDAGVTFRLVTTTAVQRDSGVIYGGTSGYEYWNAPDGEGFNVPVGFFAGAHVDGMTTTLGGGAGLLALESFHGDGGFGVVPYASATLGFDLPNNRALTFDARLARHVLAGTPDFTRWSIAVMWGTAIGR